jgi:hypothetical protein
MFSKTKTALFALAAVVAIGIGSVATSSTADARGFAGGGMSRGGGHIGGGHIGGGHLGGGRIGNVGKVGGTPWRGFRNPGFKVGQGKICRYAGCGIQHPPRPHWCRWTGRCHIHVRWPRPFIYGVGTVATSYAVAPTVATAAPAPRCTCLSKEYTQDGLVVFKDVCTKEVASAPIGNTQVQLQLPAQDQQQAPAQQ